MSRDIDKAIAMLEEQKRSSGPKTEEAWAMLALAASNIALATTIRDLPYHLKEALERLEEKRKKEKKKE